MNPDPAPPALAQRLRADAALAALDDALVAAAERLYGLGFTRISAAQIAAAGEMLAAAPSLDGARRSLRTWLRHQLERLEARVRRGRPAASWLLPPRSGASSPSLGEELLRWVEGELYLPAPAPADLDRLAALQRFWGRCAGLYRYEAVAGLPMPLTALAVEAETGA
ncbi:MAG TPA: hypothetical protein VJA16_06885, partial [Thermoanaerobaculia bacterium]